ncbi:hypothetical protein KFK09_003650 [Dendrobium nobile]|uniref:Uncharacterized protein n=1 Tax=Dendrobium nobile TaxID=94219 RepID=A0A8T3C0T8_DENNO|nr:hypothetical protein KFK09_003650 [Dendrobium nobile]
MSYHGTTISNFLNENSFIFNMLNSLRFLYGLNSLTPPYCYWNKEDLSKVASKVRIPITADIFIASKSHLTFLVSVYFSLLFHTGNPFSSTLMKGKSVDWLYMIGGLLYANHVIYFFIMQCPILKQTLSSQYFGT